LLVARGGFAAGYLLEMGVCFCMSRAALLGHCKKRIQVIIPCLVWRFSSLKTVRLMLLLESSSSSHAWQPLSAYDCRVRCDPKYAGLFLNTFLLTLLRRPWNLPRLCPRFGSLQAKSGMPSGFENYPDILNTAFTHVKVTINCLSWPRAAHNMVHEYMV
jgi:hypothetical protein